VFQKMLDLLETTPPADVNANSTVLRAYFTTVLPEHDQDRVHINDIKKCIKWFNFMLAKGIFEEAKKAAEATPEADVTATEVKGAEEAGTEEKA
jgi:hypothetical protein